MKKIGKALVVGAGIGGIRAALDLAETGYGVTLIDRAPHIGGILSQLDNQFPTNHCGMCKMLPLVQRDAASQFCLRKGLFHENIDLLLSTELTAVEGEPGRFTVALRQGPHYVDPDRCIGCGRCTGVCPVDVPDRFNAGLTLRKAIYLPVPHAIPNPFVIDAAACTRCGECAKVCPTQAVVLAGDQRRLFKILVVDDEAVVRDSLAETLKEEGFWVTVAESGAKALEVLAGQEIHLMLSDIKMPGMDGVDLLKAAKAEHPDLGVLMMTAYATVETAVEAMKIGAIDYLIKPFDPDVLIPMVVKVYERLRASQDLRLEVGAIVLCAGTDYYDPTGGKNIHGYGSFANVVTSLELERLLSGTGPDAGRLLRRDNGAPVRRIAWLQCIGSRDIQADADFCSSICCMIAVKEAMLVRQCCGPQVETVIFYMDMRCFGKSFQRYRDQAAREGVRFQRGRVHSVNLDATGKDIAIRWAGLDGTCQEEFFDMAVLAVGQRPAKGTDQVARMLALSTNPWGFIQPLPLSATLTDRAGVLAGGSWAGLKDIGESVIHASAAANGASRIIHAAGGGLAPAPGPQAGFRDVSREPSKVLVVLCSCSEAIGQTRELEGLLAKDPAVGQTAVVPRCCTAEGWDQIAGLVAGTTANRILIGACHPYAFIPRLREIGGRTGLDPALMEVVDICHPVMAGLDNAVAQQRAVLQMALARLKRYDPAPVPVVSVAQKALVVGGGIAGVTAALTIADHGYPVVLVEKQPQLGGNLNWLDHTLEGDAIAEFKAAALARVEKHPRIEVRTATEVAGGFGQVGRFLTTITAADGRTETVEHGIAVVATGGTEATTTLYGYGASQRVVTQSQFEKRLADKAFDHGSLGSVVMIQCVGSREEPRNYCSRVCCPTALKHALRLKFVNPDTAVYILYRDMMALGFAETYYTQARQAGVIFIQYEPSAKPEVVPGEGTQPVRVRAVDPILGRPVEIEADLVVLATGVVANAAPNVIQAFGIATDADGFVSEAESKWRPVDCLAEGVFACGLALAPRSVAETIATAEAAAQRALRILNRESLATGRIVASVRHSLCSVCQRCLPHCPYGARTVDLELDKIRINPAMCQGCGACAAICPNGAAVVLGWQEDAMLETIDAALFSCG